MSDKRSVLSGSSSSSNTKSRFATMGSGGGGGGMPGTPMSTASSGPSTNWGLSALPANNAPVPTGDETLCFTFQLKKLTVSCPETYPPETSYYIKWQRGKRFKGKLPPVPCPLDTVRGGALVEITLPATHQFTFEVTLHPKSKDASVFEKKLMDISIVLFNYTDEKKNELQGRETLFEANVDLRTLLMDTRVGVKTQCTIPLGSTKYEELVCEYNVVPVDPNKASGDSSGVGESGNSALLAHQSIVSYASSTGAVGGSHKSVVSSTSTTAGGSAGGGGATGDLPILQPIPLGESDEINSVLESHLKEIIWDNELQGNPKYPNFSAIQELFDSEQYRIIHTPKTLEETWACLFSAGQYSEQFHVVRQDRGYQDPGWTVVTEGFGGHKMVSYQVRISDDNYNRAIEKNVFCAAGREILAHSSTTVPDAPLIGDTAHMEFMIHLSEGLRGSTHVAMYGLMKIPGATTRALAEGRVKKNINKTLDRSVEVCQSLLSAGERSRHSLASGANRQSRFRRSLTFRPVVQQASLEPNLWLRMCDKSTMPHAHLVHQYLRRLTDTKHIKVVRERVVILENILVYHRTQIPVVTTCCDILAAFCKAVSPATMHAYSSTLIDTLKSVFELHDGALNSYEPLLAALEKAKTAATQQYEKSLLKERNFWDVLERQGASEETSVMCLVHIAEEGNSIMLQELHVQLLARSLTLHLNSEAVCNHVMQILAKAHTCGEVRYTEDLIVSIQSAIRLWPSLQARYPDIERNARVSHKQLTPFEVRYGHIVKEKVVYQCKILRYEPKVRNGTLYLTQSFICIDHNVIEFVDIVSIVQKWRALKPLVEVTVRPPRQHSRTSLALARATIRSDGTEENAGCAIKRTSGQPEQSPHQMKQNTIFSFSVWSREELLKEICSLGYVSIVRTTDE